MSSRHPLRRLATGTGVVLAVVVGSASTAFAHITIQETEQQPDSYAVLTFGVPHGCDGSPTTKVRIQLPESIPTATPTVNPGWDIHLVTEKLETPIDLGEGESLTERVTEIDYTAKTPLPATYRDALALSVHIPKEAAGTTLRFPTIQECAEGQTDWTMIPKTGQDPFELATPAPFIDVAAADAPDATPAEAGNGSSTTTSVAATADEPGDRDDSGKGLAIAGLAAGVVGMGLGGAALARSKGGAA